MALYYYTSTHAGAPQLNPTAAGSMLNILDACLVGTSGTAYGSTASIGWTLAYSATNQRSYRQPTAGSSGFYLQVTDTSTTAFSAVYARGYEAMTDITTGTNPFPTVAQMANGVVWDRGNTSTTVPTRHWCLWSNGTIFHLVVDVGVALVDTDLLLSAKVFTFGDAQSNAPTDPYKCIILGYTATGSTIQYPISTGVGVATAASYIARNQDGTSLSLQLSKSSIVDYFKYMSPNNHVYNGATFASKIILLDVPATGRTFRGFIPGLYTNNGASAYWIRWFTDMEAMSGKTFRFFTTYNTTPLAIQTSDGW